MRKETPYTDAFLSSLWQRMQSLKLRKTELARYLDTTKQRVNSWNHARRPNAESVLKIQKWEKLK